MGRPRRNEKRFYRYPWHRIVLGVHTDTLVNVLDVLRSQGGHHLLHFRRWTIEEIR